MELWGFPRDLGFVGGAGVVPVRSLVFLSRFDEDDLLNVRQIGLASWLFFYNFAAVSALKGLWGFGKEIRPGSSAE